VYKNIINEFVNIGISYQVVIFASVFLRNIVLTGVDAMSLTIWGVGFIAAIFFLPSYITKQFGTGQSNNINIINYGGSLLSRGARIASKPLRMMRK
jgi:hypothetical protein